MRTMTMMMRTMQSKDSAALHSEWTQEAERPLGPPAIARIIRMMNKMIRIMMRMIKKMMRMIIGMMKKMIRIMMRVMMMGGIDMI